MRNKKRSTWALMAQLPLQQQTLIGNMNYTGLHVHTHYSLFDGVATPEEYVDRAVELGMPALAITVTEPYLGIENCIELQKQMV